MSTPAGQQSSLLTDSVVMTDNLAAVAEVAIDRVIGTMSMTDVETALRHTLMLFCDLFSQFDNLFHRWLTYRNQEIVFLRFMLRS